MSCRFFIIILKPNKCNFMVNFKELVALRRSHRKFLPDTVSSEDVRHILRAALMSPTSKNRRSWQFVVVDDKHPAGTHRIDREPITEQNAGVLARLSRDDKRRAEHEGSSASRRQKRGHRGNSTRRDVVEGGGKRGKGSRSKGRGGNKRRR